MCVLQREKQRRHQEHQAREEAAQVSNCNVMTSTTKSDFFFYAVLCCVCVCVCACMCVWGVCMCACAVYFAVGLLVATSSVA